MLGVHRIHVEGHKGALGIKDSTESNRPECTSERPCMWLKRHSLRISSSILSRPFQPYNMKMWEGQEGVSVGTVKVPGDVTMFLRGRDEL